MIIVRVELHSAITGRVTELARMRIANRGLNANPRRGDYDGVVFRGRSTPDLDRQVEQKTAAVDNYPRQQLHVWNLVARMLAAMGYA